VWGVPFSEFSLDSLIVAEGDELSRQVLTTPIISQGFSLFIKLELYNNFEGFKTLICLGFELLKIHPSVLTIVVYECHEVMNTTHRYCFDRAT
jgi:hypothetical protein